MPITQGTNLPSNLPSAEDVTDQIRSPLDDGGVKNVNQPTEEYKTLNDRWRMLRALQSGTDAMRDEEREYLPQEEAETNKSYVNRLGKTVLFAAYKKTIVTSTGRPFSRPINFDGFSSRLDELSENIDLRGNNIHVFSRDVFESGLAYGHSFVLADHTRRPDITGEASEMPSLEVERDSNLRPFWRKYDASDVIGWRSDVIDGVEVLTQARIRESAIKPVGMFGEKTVERVRVLFPGEYQLYEKNEAGDWIVIEGGQFLTAAGTVLNKVPLIPFYSTMPESFLNTIPVMLDLGFQNILHWQSGSDQENILHVARVPILFGAGFFDNDDIEIGASRWIKGPEGSSLDYVEHSGASIEAGRKSLEDLENRMRIMGAEVLVRDPARITATQKVLDTDEATSELQDIVGRFEDFLQQCYALTAEWIGEPETSVGTIDIFKDFGIGLDSFQEAQALLQSRTALQITQERYLREIKRRGILGDDTDIEAEIAITKQEQSEAQLIQDTEFE